LVRAFFLWLNCLLQARWFAAKDSSSSADTSFMKEWTLSVKNIFVFAAVVALAHGLAQAQTVRLHGATTLEKMVSAQKAGIETQAGVKLEVVGNGAGRGLGDLSSGQAEVAMLAGSLKGIADAVNKEKPGSVDASGMKETPLGNSKIVLVVHPAAGVKSITEAQLHDLLVGKVTQWKDLGGGDVAVKLVLPFAGDGVRVTVQEQVLKGEDFVKSAILRNSAKDIPPVIGQLPGSISFLSEKNAAGMTTVACDKDIQMPLLLVTKGEPAGDIKKAVDAIKALVK
jgi:phosphate transport system substrate-binding protein